MKIPFFFQDIGAFLSNKTNYLALIIIGVTAYGFYKQTVSYNEAIAGFTSGFGLLVFRDAIAKVEKK